MILTLCNLDYVQSAIKVHNVHEDSAQFVNSDVGYNLCSWQPWDIYHTDICQPCNIPGRITLST